MERVKKRFDATSVPILNWDPPPYENPLTRRFKADFFSKIPRGPGVYCFRDAQGEILYVGKAKNLRARLLSYRRAKPDREARKVLRFLERTDSITWEECRSERDALLRENELLRELDPEFNVLNTRPEFYYFVGIRPQVSTAEGEPFRMRFRLTRHADDRSITLYGCFRSKRRLKEGYAALLRLVWAALCEEARFSMPSRLARRSPPYDYSLPFPPEWIPALESFLEGRSSRLLGLIMNRLLENPLVPEFMYRGLQNDLETAREFFQRGPRQNRRLRLHHRLTARTIAQDEIDDLMVHEAVRRGRVQG